MFGISSIRLDDAKLAEMKSLAAELSQLSTPVIERIAAREVLKAGLELAESYTPAERRELGMRSPASYRRELKKL